MRLLNSAGLSLREPSTETTDISDIWRLYSAPLLLLLLLVDICVFSAKGCTSEEPVELEWAEPGSEEVGLNGVGLFCVRRCVCNLHRCYEQLYNLTTYMYEYTQIYAQDWKSKTFTDGSSTNVSWFNFRGLMCVIFAQEQ